MTAVQVQCYTPADLLAMPDSDNLEVVNGHLVEKRGSVLRYAGAA